ncbi:MAG: hypothetical protein WC812_00200 [Candidatus Pacearchaeota archaeon]|jgi:hypothetical protein
MESEKLIHLKFENNEAILAKKDLLLMQSELIKLIVKIKEFQKLRSLELKNKIKMNSKIKIINANLGKLDKLLPEIEKPKFLKKSSKENSQLKELKKSIEKKPQKSSLEQELEEIQERLKKLDEKL